MGDSLEKENENNGKGKDIEKGDIIKGEGRGVKIGEKGGVSKMATMLRIPLDLPVCPVWCHMMCYLS